MKAIVQSWSASIVLSATRGFESSKPISRALVPLPRHKLEISLLSDTERRGELPSRSKVAFACVIGPLSVYPRLPPSNPSCGKNIHGCL